MSTVIKGRRSIRRPTKVAPSIKKYVAKAVKRVGDTLIEQSHDDNKALSFAAPIVVDVANCDETSRVGNRIKVLGIKGAVEVLCNAAVEASWARVILVCDKLNTGTIPTLTDIFPGMTITNLGSTQVGEVSKDNRQRWRILYDRIKLVGYEVGDMGHQQIRFPVNLRGLNIPVYFNGTGPTDESKNHIFMFLTIGTNDGDVTTSYDIRTSYKDV